MLHYLCHFLNESGREAFLVIHGKSNGALTINPKLKTPILDSHALGQHKLAKREIWVVYPESVPGNPLNANQVIRWLLNFPSLLGGEAKYGDDIVLAYSKKIADQFYSKNGILVETLFVPALLQEDAEMLFEMGNVAHKGTTKLSYAQKFRNLGGTISAPIKNEAIEIRRFGRLATSRQETLRLLAGAKVIYVYENSTIITEAQLLGTPVVCIENYWFNELIAEYELGSEGVSWSGEAVLGIPEVILNRINDHWSKLPAKLNALFSLQEKVGNNSNSGITLPKQRLISMHAINRGRIVLTQKGPKVAWRFARAYFIRTRPK